MEEEEVFQIVMQMLANQVDLVVAVVVQMLVAHLDLLEQEIPHQYHHHKEILEEQEHLQIPPVVAVVVEALVLLVGMEVLLKVEMVEQDKHHLFLEHQ